MQELLELPQLARGSGGCAVKRKEGQLVGEGGRGAEGEGGGGGGGDGTTQQRHHESKAAPRPSRPAHPAALVTGTLQGAVLLRHYAQAWAGTCSFLRDQDLVCV